MQPALADFPGPRRGRGVDGIGACHSIFIAWRHGQPNFTSQPIIEQWDDPLLHDEIGTWLKKSHASGLMSGGHVILPPGDAATHLVQLPQLAMSMLQWGNPSPD